MDESTKLSTGIKKGESSSRLSCNSLNLQNYPLQTKVVAIGALSALVFLVVVVLSLVVVFTSLEIFYAEDAPLYKTNNLIFLIGDGFGPGRLNNST